MSTVAGSPVDSVTVWQTIALPQTEFLPRNGAADSAHRSAGHVRASLIYAIFAAVCTCAGHLPSGKFLILKPEIPQDNHQVDAVASSCLEREELVAAIAKAKGEE